MKQYVADAFSDRIFCGNPAAVCVLERWLSDAQMQKIAKENNLSETAFVVPDAETYHLRWFTPGGEIDLCGHATLAAAYVLLNFVDPDRTSVAFETMSGSLSVARKEELYEMEFPSYKLSPVKVTEEMCQALGARPSAAFMGRDLLCVFDEEDTVRNLSVDLERARKLDGLLLQVTAPGTEYDCVSRSFGPKLGIAEDPVCGSGHCHIAPYWMRVLQTDRLTAYQASERGGVLYCRNAGDHVILGGKAALYSIAELFLP